ncbi:MAG TPA: glycosyltransferase family A protein [Bacteroidales bacterium]|jgi:hypothetical protein|nr:glycosyltransferase family A protein [Bacteroidales bacterium]
MKDFASSYLKKHQLQTPEISEPPSGNIGFIVVIPVLCEPDIIQTLESIWKCTRPSCDTEVLMIVNASEKAPDNIVECNCNTTIASLEWIRQHQDDSLKFFVLNVTLPDKDAGVGLARKIGMDAAIRRFNETGRSRGFILSFDADSICDPDYFSAIEETINLKPDTKGFTIYFEHPVSGINFPERIYQGIAQYELHLRYVNLYLAYSGFPYAFHTVGSCFGVRADIYAAQGGMNKRKGGEDFYFLHKIVPLGNFEVINSTRVIPSPRDSFRVPFGTGPVIHKYMETGLELTTYDPEAFRLLRQFLSLFPRFYKSESSVIRNLTGHLDKSIREFLEIMHFTEAIEEINSNSGSPDTFRNRFFRWFDAFRIIKFLNYSAINHFPKQPVTKAVTVLLNDLNVKVPERRSPPELLHVLRRIERGS